MASDPPILDGEPDFVAGLLEAIAKVGETPATTDSKRWPDPDARA
jgi:hypothetical protein